MAKDPERNAMEAAAAALLDRLPRDARERAMASLTAEQRAEVTRAADRCWNPSDYR